MIFIKKKKSLKLKSDGHKLQNVSSSTQLEIAEPVSPWCKTVSIATTSAAGT